MRLQTSGAAPATRPADRCSFRSTANTRNLPTFICPATVSSAPRPDLTGRILRHERAVVAASVTLLAALAWWYIVQRVAADGPRMGSMRGPPVTALIVMWCFMMAAAATRRGLRRAYAQLFSRVGGIPPRSQKETGGIY